ncbi:hypothetical protein QM646_37260, partial [Rhodococcus erythropolis]|nr:hypothetical protein [Rhodococcus erythropolis]
AVCRLTASRIGPGDNSHTVMFDLVISDESGEATRPTRRRADCGKTIFINRPVKLWIAIYLVFCGC